MKVRSNGIEINYEVDGNGPWVTLSHSLACNVHMWDEQMEVLTKSYKVLRFDTRGHGLSSAPPAPYTLSEMADDVHGLFAALGIKRTHWVGLSMGGMIGQTYALEHPGVLQSLFLADTTSRRPPDAAKMWGDRIRIAREQGMEALVESTLARWFTEPFRKSQPQVMKRIGDYIRTTPVDGFCGSCEAISRVDTLDRLKQIKCPAYILVGEQDHGTPPDMARAIHQNLAGSELLIVPSAAHLSNVEQTQVFNQAMLIFLGQASR